MQINCFSATLNYSIIRNDYKIKGINKYLYRLKLFNFWKNIYIFMPINYENIWGILY